MHAFANRALLAASLVSVAALLAGCNGGSASPAIPGGSAEFTRPNAKPAGIKIWAAAEQTSKLFGLSSGGASVIKVISTESQPVKGGNPLTLKVDGNDLFVTDVSGGKAGVIQEYDDARFVRAYSPDCPVSSCSNFTGSLSDTVVDKNYVFAIMKLIQYQAGSQTISRSGYEYWPRDNPSATPVAVFLPSDCSAICFYDAGDEDSSGNLWLRDYGGGGYGLAEIRHPTTNPSISQALSLETFTIKDGDIAGFSISNAGTVLNVGDSSHKIYQYALPVMYGDSPFNTLVPCVQGCDPHGFGLNSTNNRIIVGDGLSKGWLDLGQVPEKQWRKIFNPQFTVPFSSAVFLPGG
ncbi:MAG: hypothetical protein JOZ01_07015 [Candidatus Eremiobacteraeota bacterium]|nr:hypothetical protein [Candidatus Eremiobacteraeota bacterium]